MFNFPNNPSLVIATVLLGMTLSGSLLAQDQQSELGARQKLIERKMLELENRFMVIAEKLKDQEPEKYKRLIVTYQKAKESLITSKMATVTKLLNNGRYDEAQERLDEVIAGLQDLLKLLLNNKPKELNKQQQIEQFEKWKKTIESIRQQQTSQRKETNKIANRDEELKKLDQQIKKLDNLIGRQRGLMEKRRGQTELDCEQWTRSPTNSLTSAMKQNQWQKKLLTIRPKARQETVKTLARMVPSLAREGLCLTARMVARATTQDRTTTRIPVRKTTKQNKAPAKRVPKIQIPPRISSSRDNNSLDSNSRDNNSRDSNSRDSNSRDSNSRDSNSRDNNSRDSNSRDSNSRDSNSRDSNSRDSNSRDSNSRDSNSRDSNSRDSNSRVSNSRVSNKTNLRNLARLLWRMPPKLKNEPKKILEAVVPKMRNENNKKPSSNLKKLVPN